jgi:hypothetical protein
LSKDGVIEKHETGNFIIPKKAIDFHKLILK